MAFLDVNPRYRDQLARLGLTTPSDFLELPGVILCGHPDRHVARVTFGKGGAALHAFLKREHRTRWRDRLANAWAGFGFVSKSHREFRVLRDLAPAGVGCPEVLAAGEDGQGRAFVLLREVPAARELRTFLTEGALAPAERRRIAIRLGEALARLHAAGFDHPDLYSKHVLVSGARDAPAFQFLDWQRSRRGRPGWVRRWRDLAALDATLADELASPRDRLVCLRAYLAATVASGLPVARLARAARQVHARTARLLKRRRIGELRQPPLPVGVQNLIWLDGEALCVTREFRAEVGHIPEWLTLPVSWPAAGARTWRNEVAFAPGRHALLVHRHSSRPLAWLWSWLRRGRLTSPELEQAGTLFRLQRYGVVTPRLLAVGQRHSAPWRTASLLLTEALPGTLPLVEWLRRGGRRERGRILGEAGAVLRRLHDAGCCLNPRAPGEVLLVQTLPGEPARVVLGNVEGLQRQRPGAVQVRRDLALLDALFAEACGRMGQRRFLLGYLGVRLLKAPVRPASGGRGMHSRPSLAVDGLLPGRVAG